MSSDFEFSTLPPEALQLVVQVLMGSGDERFMAVARRLESGSSLVLESETAAGEGTLFLSLPQFRVVQRKRPAPNPVLYTRLDPELVKNWFSPDGEFARAMPGYESRPEQMEMASAVAEAFSDAKHLVVEAGTGVGKTLAYLVPSVLWSLANNLPVVICTSTKNLQEQLFRKDLPLIVSLLRQPLSFALVKGRSNYVCLSRLEAAARHPDVEFSPDQLPALASALAWAFRTASGDLAEFEQERGEEGTAGIRDLICSNPDECRGRRCRYYSRCFLQRARAEGQAADVVVTNHAVFFAEPSAQPLALPKAAQVVFDEAHNLEESATSSFEREFSTHVLRRTLRKLMRSGRGRSGKNHGLVPDLERELLTRNFLISDDSRKAFLRLLADVRDAMDDVAQSSRRYFRALGCLPRTEDFTLRLLPSVLESGPWNDTLPALRKLQDDLAKLCDCTHLLSRVFKEIPEGAPPPEREGVPLLLASPAALAGAGAGDAESGPVSDFARRVDLADAALAEAAGDLEFLSSATKENWAFWVAMSSSGKFSRAPTTGELHAAPIEVAELLNERIFAKLDSAVLCSATIGVGDSVRFMSGRLGLDRVDSDRLAVQRMGSPFDYPSQCLCCAAQFLPPQAVGDGLNQTTLAFIESFGDFLVKLLAVTKGRTLVLFTSYSMMNAVAERICDALREGGIRLLMQGAGISRETLTSLFRDESSPSVLFGTDSFREGVDIVGSTLSCVVLAKLPFAAVGDPLVSARTDSVQAKTGNSFHNYSVPQAIIKFRQGFGRLIRHKTDRGVVIVADDRIYTKSYGAQFRRNLPIEPVQYKNEERLLRDVDAFLNHGRKELAQG